MKTFTVLLATLALLATPFASAAVTVTGPDEARMLPASGSTDVTYVVTIDCQEFVDQASASLDITLEATGLKSWVGASSETVSASAESCLTGLPGTSIDVPVKLSLAAGSDAWGHSTMTYAVVASAGSTTSAAFSHAQPIQVAYVDGHTLSTTVAFPYNFTAADGDSLVFNMTLDIQANGNTMVMFIAPTAAGGISGLKHQIFDLEGGDLPSRTSQITWTPPTGAWTNDTISFYNYSHCLKGSPCDETNTKNVTWTIHNMAGNTGGDSGKDSPAATPVLLALALVGIAFVVRRRN